MVADRALAQAEPEALTVDAETTAGQRSRRGKLAFLANRNIAGVSRKILLFQHSREK